jgi:secondary thiamine-phosphate synthase enzyme
MDMSVISEQIYLKTEGNAEMMDITKQVMAAVSDSGIENGIVTIFLPGSTGAITTIEYESGLEEDMKNALNRVFPENIDYKHNLRWGDGNGHSHIRASFLGPSLTIPFVNRKLQLGTWQQIVFIDLDNRPRSRKLILQIIGE